MNLIEYQASTARLQRVVTGKIIYLAAIAKTPSRQEEFKRIRSELETDMDTLIEFMANNSP